MVLESAELLSAHVTNLVVRARISFSSQAATWSSLPSQDTSPKEDLYTATYNKNGLQRSPVHGLIHPGAPVSVSDRDWCRTGESQQRQPHKVLGHRQRLLDLGQSHYRGVLVSYAQGFLKPSTRM